MEQLHRVALDMLGYRAGKSAHEEFVRLRSAANRARGDSEKAATELERHTYAPNSPSLSDPAFRGK